MKVSGLKTKSNNLNDRSSDYLFAKQAQIQFVSLKFCNDALSELMQCELNKIDFSLIINKKLKKTGPDLCFQPMFKLVDLDRDDHAEHL